MKDVLFFFGLFLFVGIFIYAMIHTARKQRKEKAGVFRDFADKNGLRYQEEDDGKAQKFAQDFDGIGRFSSPSLGKVIPKDVVDGGLNGSNIKTKDSLEKMESPCPPDAPGRYKVTVIAIDENEVIIG
jgi:hypothetical protein